MIHSLEELGKRGLRKQRLVAVVTVVHYVGYALGAFLKHLPDLNFSVSFTDPQG